MNILVIYPYIPYPLDRGTFQRTFHLLRGLAGHHTVDLLALSEGGERFEHQGVFEEFCREVRFIPFEHPPWPKLNFRRLFDSVPATVRHWTLPHVATAVQMQLKRHRYDLVHVCDIVMAQYFLVDHKEVPLSVDRSRVDLQYQWESTKIMAKTFKDRFLAGENILKLWRFEKRIARRASMEVLCGPDDEVFVRRHISSRVPLKVVANGADLAHFSPGSSHDVRALRPTMIFCGAMDYTPNVDALRWYFGKIHDRLVARIPDLQVLVVGKDPLPEVSGYAAKPGVTVTGSVPDVRPYYKQAWLQMVPLRIGGGTRLKIVESLAIGTPVLSTTIGAQGLSLVHDVNILLADTPEHFVTQAAKALSDPALRGRLAEAGSETAQKRFSWLGISAGLSKTYQETFGPEKGRVSIMGVPFDRVTMNQTLSVIESLIHARSPRYLATANVDFVVQARKDKVLSDILKRARLVVCDGTPLVWVSRLLGQPLPERVAGSDLVPQLLQEAERKDWSIFILGGQEKILEQAVIKVKHKHPGLRIVGSFSPPFSPLETMDHEGICDRIRKTRPDILLVSFGCPKQEKWIDLNHQNTGVPVTIGVGATVDFLAGAMRRAPRWMQVIGMEWVFRLLQEPRRLARRYATDLFVFGFGVIREVLTALFFRKATRPQ